MITVVYTEIPPDLFKCYKCQETFLSEIDLDHYQKIEAGGLHFRCKACGAKFEDAAYIDLQDHKGFHTGDKRHICSTRRRKLAMVQILVDT